MLWFYAVALSAVSWGVISVVAKELMDHDPSHAYTTLYTLTALVFYTPVFLYFLASQGLSVNRLAVTALLFSIIGNIAAFTAYNTAIKQGELSRIIPFTRLTPIFTGVFAALILGERITPMLGAGIVFATAGSIVVMKEDHVDYLLSIEDSLGTQAIQLAVASSAIYGLASVADRFATQIIAPEAYTFFLFLGMSTGLLALTRRSETHSAGEILEDFNNDRMLYSLTGLLAAAATFCIFYAFSRAPASKVVPVIQLQVLVSVVAGVVFFDEDNLARKLAGSLILIAGVGLVAL
ncbi:MAG: EamA family transporter [Candidatus Nanohaloarchaea archaeon]